MQALDIPRRSDVPQIAAGILVRLRAQTPRVHCITNTVAQNFTANALLAVGALPSMTTSLEEIGEFVAHTQALLVNLGTFDGERRKAVTIALDTAKKNKIPWVLDPVLIDRSPLRAIFAREMTVRGPQALRLNHVEFSTLSGTSPVPDALSLYAKDHKVVVGLSGASDFVTDGSRLATLANGHPWMAKVTGMGCVASALTAACLAVESDAWRATATALLLLGIAGEVAAVQTKGPGSFAAAIIDALANLDGATIIERARVT
jgi:hydroxyethylthiazole kinase